MTIRRGLAGFSCLQRPQFLDDFGVRGEVHVCRGVNVTCPVAYSTGARPGARRQASIWYQLPGAARGIMTVIVSVPPNVAHQPPLILVSTALRPATVVLAFGMCHAGKPLALHLTRTPPGGRTRIGYAKVWAIRPGLVLTVHGPLNRLVLK